MRGEVEQASIYRVLCIFISPIHYKISRFYMQNNILYIIVDVLLCIHRCW